MDRKRRNDVVIAHHIFSGSTTMTGVCITVITLFMITKNSITTIADEIIGIDAFLFIIAAFISYMSLKHNNHKKLEWIADTFFFTGMVIMVFVGLVIVFVEH